MKLQLSTFETKSATIGVMRYNGFECHTLELPWLDNKGFVSCIPAGTYECVKHHSPGHGYCISIKNVPSRFDVLIHKGNFNRDTRGCILVGQYIKDIDNDGMIDVANSGPTFGALMSELPNSFQLVIRRLTNKG